MIWLVSHLHALIFHHAVVVTGKSAQKVQNFLLSGGGAIAITRQKKTPKNPKNATFAKKKTLPCKKSANHATCRFPLSTGTYRKEVGSGNPRPCFWVAPAVFHPRVRGKEPEEVSGRGGRGVDCKSPGAGGDIACKPRPTLALPRPRGVQAGEAQKASAERTMGWAGVGVGGWMGGFVGVF